MSAAHYGLDNLTAICNRNRLQIDGRTAEVMSLEPCPRNGGPSAGTPWRWTVIISPSSWRPFRPAAASPAGPRHYRPYRQGKGVSIFEDKAKYHGTTPNDEEYQQALQELGG